MLEIGLLVVGIVVLLGILEVLGVKLLEFIARKANERFAGKRIRFGLSTALILVLMLGGIFHLSVTSQNGAVSYTGWPLPSKSAYQLRRVINPNFNNPATATLHWNALNIVLNVFVALVLLFFVGWMLERFRK